VEEVAQTKGEGWAVILFNDDVHSFDEVISAIIKATGFDIEAAVAITMRAHNHGKAVVLITDKAEAERVASVLRTAKLTVEIRAV
jgi:ATP-dependent Clp protease adapter protein ClpS